MRIEELTGRRVEHFCYPYGGSAEISAAAPSMRATASARRPRSCAGAAAPADLALLPRVPLYEGDSKPIVALKVATAR